MGKCCSQVSDTNKELYSPVKGERQLVTINLSPSKENNLKIEDTFDE